MCGRSARTVRREEGPTQVGPSYPYQRKGGCAADRSSVRAPFRVRSYESRLERRPYSEKGGCAADRSSVRAPPAFAGAGSSGCDLTNRAWKGGLTAKKTAAPQIPAQARAPAPQRAPRLAAALVSVLPVSSLCTTIREFLRSARRIWKVEYNRRLRR